MYTENFYVGNDEYVIIYKNGTHHIIDVAERENTDRDGIVFTGHYDKCLEHKQEMLIGYAESLF